MEWARNYGRIYVLNVLLNLIFYSLCLVYSAVILFTIGFHYLRKPSKYSWTVKSRARPEALENPLFGAHKFIQLQNVKLHYVEAGSREKPLMIFIHGFPDFWYSWRHQIKQFAQDYWIIALDTRGYGDSEKPKGIQFYKLNYLIDDLKNLIDGLETNKIKMSTSFASYISMMAKKDNSIRKISEMPIGYEYEIEKYHRINTKFGNTVIAYIRYNGPYSMDDHYPRKFFLPTRIVDSITDAMIEEYDRSHRTINIIYKHFENKRYDIDFV